MYLRRANGRDNLFLKAFTGGKGIAIYEKAFTWRFVLDVLKLRNFPDYVLNMATVDAHGMFYRHSSVLVFKYLVCVVIYKYCLHYR